MKKIEVNSIKSRIILGFLIMFILLVIILCYYYISLRRSMEDQSQLLFDQISGKTIHQMEDRLNTLENVAKSTGYYSIIQKVLFSKSANEKVQNLKPARELIATNKASYPFIVDIFLYVHPHTRLYTNSTYAEQFRSNLQHNNFDPDIQLDAPLFSNFEDISDSPSLFFYYLPISNIIYNGTLIEKSNNGLCVILCDINDLYQTPEGLDSGSAILALKDNNNLVSANQALDKSFHDQLINLKSGNSRFVYNGISYYAKVVPIQGNVQIVCAIPNDSIHFNSTNPTNILYMLIIIGTLVIIIFLFLNTHTISSSVNSLLRDLNRLQSSYNVRLNEPKLKEFLLLTKQINIMLDRLEASVTEKEIARDKLYQANLLQHKAEMIAYRNQINPHFLFNTMECMRSMAQYYHVEHIEQLVIATAKMFHYSLYTESIVPLSKEIDHVQQYMTVTNIRFPDFFTLKLNITKEAEAFRIPSMLLQPLIENSVKHAFFQEGSGKRMHSKVTQKKQHLIQIKAWIEDAALLHIQIVDNGSGMTDAELATLKLQNLNEDDQSRQAKDSIGIQNINKRIKLHNSQNKIIYSSRYGYYTKVHVKLYFIPVEHLKDINNSFSCSNP